MADINKAIQKDPQQAAKILGNFWMMQENRGNKLLVANLSVILYELQGANANPQNLVSIGVDFYQGGNFTKADSLFKAYSKAFPDSVYGYYWSARLNAQIDSTMAQGLAVPQYEQVLRIAALDTSRLFIKVSVFLPQVI